MPPSVSKPQSALIRPEKIRRATAAICIPVFFLLCFTELCTAQEQRSLCSNGFGSFNFKFSTGVTVAVGAAKNGAFATHACDASLLWRKSSLHAVLGAYLIDVDALGIDLGFGVPVVAFRIKNAESDNLMSYQIYSLQQPPRLLRTLSGASFYEARDIDLDGHNEILATDPGAADGIDGLPLSSFDALPTAVLGFEKNHLIDVGSRFQPYFDSQIAQVKTQINAGTLNDFKKTDGRLSSVPPQLLGNFHQILRTKIAALEIVWAYLYSGREQEAWNSLAEMWPPSDLNRIRGAIQDARSHGVLAQVDETAEAAPQHRQQGYAAIYKVKEKQTRMPSSGDLASMIAAGIESSNSAEEHNEPAADVAPQSIYLAMPATYDDRQVIEKSQMYVDVIVDGAGKVHSAQLVSGTGHPSTEDALVKSTANWNFIPAFKAGRPVACKLRIGISPQE